ncbi:MAG: selenocysteine-specific translation elongation factor [Bacillota bacterium]
MRHVVIGTAGHVDHGKTALIRALTGRDTDRLPEEKERGISIDLGFAPMVLPDGKRAAVVDVPGHERFIRNMLAGATGINLVLLVVAADEGVMPQTREHLDILDLLGVPQGIIVLTKADLVDAEWLSLIAEDVRRAVAGTFLADSPCVAVSVVDGRGLAELMALVQTAVAQVPTFSPAGYARLPIDRVFTVTGFGTVVTGTLTSGRVKREDRLELLPAGRGVRIRQVHVHDELVDHAVAGQRVALNLTGVEREDVTRGQVLAAAGYLAPTQSIGASLKLLSSAPRPLLQRARVHLHTGTTEVLARVVTLEGTEVAPGQEALVWLRIERPVVVARDDRYIIRSYSPMHTIGGGVVIAPRLTVRRGGRAPVAEYLRQRLQGDPVHLVRQALAGAKLAPLTGESVAKACGLDVDSAAMALADLAHTGAAKRLDGNLFVDGTLWLEAAARLIAEVESFHRRERLKTHQAKEDLRTRGMGGLEAKVFNALLADLAAQGTITVDRDRVALAGHAVRLAPAEAHARAKLEALYREGDLAPPDTATAVAEAKLPPALVRSLLSLLVEEGLLTKVADDVFFHRDAVAKAWPLVEGRLREVGQLTVAEARDLFGTSRKHALPLLEYFDGVGLTRRSGDVRVAARAGLP